MYLDGITALTVCSLEKGAGAATVLPTKGQGCGDLRAQRRSEPRLPCESPGAAPPKSSRGVGDTFQVSWLVRAPQWMGHRDVVLQCDQEVSMRALLDLVASKREQKTLVREVPRKSHQTLGGDERWNQTVQEQFRVLRGQLEDDLKVQLKSHMPVCAWLLRHAAWLVTRYQPQRARGGLTAYARIQGEPYHGKVVRFGERVLVYVPQDSSGKGPKRSSKFRDRWMIATWLGKAEDSDEHIVVSKIGVTRHRTLRRLPELDPQRWSPSEVVEMTAVPWDVKSQKPTLGQLKDDQGELKGSVARPSGAMQAMSSHGVTEAAHGIST